MAKYDLTGRVVAITGSTGGLGSAVAIELVRKGARLALMDVSEDAARAQAEQLGGPGVAKGWRVDVRDMESIELAMAEAAEHFGRIDVAFANAGVESMSPMEKLDPKVFDRVMDINANGVWRTFRAALPYVRIHKGYLAATSSMAAFVHSPLQSPYTASKAAVWAMCDSIRIELRHQSVAVGSYHPTFFHTPMMDNVFSNPAGMKVWGGNKGGIWRMVSKEEVVQAIVQGMERRAEMVVIPKANNLVAKAPGLFRKWVDKIGFKESDIREAISLAKAEG
ncbi:SDR family NAD(P)-dependent oxidoreductase [Pseudomonas citronellolis]|uniref:SDR family NAD(P)-dependent oxidoreductase n=1 Tax=Pseudomonas citronellolis TaxID=53408 RepID=UPI0023E3EDCE|nr:SDR family NAD(P)-dependent oxidoreductase [Pseudomonas citronellolis]MDF3933705.1 SDR family NAD(P)-dependent oxidoreductase [Pseudomonas citronellolis]